jgi:hypothetical protein
VTGPARYDGRANTARPEDVEMTREEQNAVNQEAARRLKPTIDAEYPPKQFVAIAGGQIVADDADIERLHEKIRALGFDPQETLVDRAGEDTLSELLIL